VTLEQQILAKNNLLAKRNRGWFAGRRILALNLMSSPGAGKTTLRRRSGNRDRRRPHPRRRVQCGSNQYRDRVPP
jgi:hypothetical protein